MGMNNLTIAITIRNFKFYFMIIIHILYRWKVINKLLFWTTEEPFKNEEICNGLAENKYQVAYINI